MSARENSTRVRIECLIVSDDDDLNCFTRFLLEADGFRVSGFDNARDIAIKRCSATTRSDFLRSNFQDGNSLGLLEFIQEACPDIAIFTVVKPESCTHSREIFETRRERKVLL